MRRAGPELLDRPAEPDAVVQEHVFGLRSAVADRPIDAAVVTAVLSGAFADLPDAVVPGPFAGRRVGAAGLPTAGAVLIVAAVVDLVAAAPTGGAAPLAAAVEPVVAAPIGGAAPLAAAVEPVVVAEPDHCRLRGVYRFEAVGTETVGYYPSFAGPSGPARWPDRSRLPTKSRRS